MIDKPEIYTDEHKKYLDELRDSGVTNMFGADRYVVSKFDLTIDEARDIVTYWMKSFGK